MHCVWDVKGRGEGKRGLGRGEERGREGEGERGREGEGERGKEGEGGEGEIEGGRDIFILTFKASSICCFRKSSSSFFFSARAFLAFCTNSVRKRGKMPLKPM